MPSKVRYRSWKAWSVLESIKLELRAPFRDARKPFERPSPDALVRLLTREPAAGGLRPGVRAAARVVLVGDSRLMVRLDCGLRGFIYADRAPQVQMASAPSVAARAAAFQLDGISTLVAGE